MLRFIYLDNSLPENIKNAIESKYGQYVSDIIDLAAIIVSDTDKPRLDDLGRLIIPHSIFDIVIDDIIQSILSNNTFLYKKIIDSILNFKLH